MAVRLGSQVDLVITKLREYGGIAAVIEFLINPPPWFIFPAIIIGFLLIWWDTARRQKPIIVGDQANFHSVVEDQPLVRDQPLVGNPTSSLIDSPISETVASHDYRWQFDSQMAVEVAARLRNTTEWQDKLIVDVTPEYLWGLFWEHTSLQGDNLAKSFLNRWMIVCGPFGDVSPVLPNARQTVVAFAFRLNPRVVLMYFNENWLAHLEIIIPRQKIVVIGRIDSINSHTIQLKDCTLVQ
jgi:hypothetical protein